MPVDRRGAEERQGRTKGSEGFPDYLESVVAGWAEDVPEVQAIWLFGSRARGEGRTDSDYDVGIRTRGACPSEAQGTWIAMATQVRAEWASLLPGLDLSLQGTGPGWGVGAGTEQTKVWPGVLADGVLLYEAWEGAALAPHDLPNPTGDGFEKL